MLSKKNYDNVLKVANKLDNIKRRGVESPKKTNTLKI